MVPPCEMRDWGTEGPSDCARVRARNPGWEEGRRKSEGQRLGSAVLCWGLSR